MAQEFNIPGLKDAIAEMTKLNETVLLLSKNVLDVAIDADKAMKPFKDVSGIKGFTEAQQKSNETRKTTKEVVDKLAQAEEKLKYSQSEVAKQIAAVNVQTQQQNQNNKASAQIIDLNSEALKKEVTSIAEARAQNTLLTQARNNVNLTTVEGQLQLTTFNAKLDENNAFIKANGDAALKQKMQIGDYAGGVKSAMEQTGLFSGKIGQLSNTAIGFVQSGAQAVTKIKDVSDAVVNGAKNVGTYVAAKVKMITTEKAGVIAIEESTIATEANAIATAESRVQVAGFTMAEKAQTIATEASAVATQGMSVAQVGLAATTDVAAGAEVAATATTWGLNTALGILLFPITAVVLAFGVLVYIFKDFAPVINPIKDAFAALMAVFEVLKSSVFALVTGTKSLGEVFSSLGAETSKAADEAYKLAAANREIIVSQRALELSSAKAQAEITKLITQSKNRTLSEEERMKMLAKAIEMEKENVAAKLTLNNKEIAAARMKLADGKEISEEDMKQLAKGNANYAQEIKKKYNLDQDEIDHLRKIQVERYGLIEASSRVVEKANNFSDKLAENKQNKEDKAREKKEKDDEKAQQTAEKNAERELNRQKKTAEEAIKTMKITLDNEIAAYDQSAKLDSENIAHVQAIENLKKGIAQAELNTNLIGLKVDEDILNKKIAQNKKLSLDELSYVSIKNATAQELIKIENEKTKALEKIQKDGVKFEIELYDLNNKTLIKEGKTLTDLLVNEEKKRIQQSLDIHKKGMRDELNIDKSLSDEKLKQMSKTNGALTANQLKYLQGIQKLEESKDKDIKKLDADLLNTKVKNINTEVKNEQNKNKLLNKSALAQAKDAFKLEDKRLKDLRKLYKDDAEKIKEIDDEIAANKQLIDKTVSDNKKKLLEDGLNNVIAVFGQESAVGKAAAIAQVTMDTYKSATSAFAGMVEAFPGPWGIAAGVAAAALSVGMGLSNVAKIVGIKMFAEGTNDAPYTGKAIVDEDGAEIHTDASGNIKSFGSDSGAHLTDIVKGDKIIPADISAIIRQTMFSSYGMSAQQQTIDYGKIGEQFGKHASKIVNAVNNNGKNQLSVMIQKGISDRVIFKGKSV